MTPPSAYGQGSIEPRGRRFRVRIYLAGKPKYLGTYSTREEAEGVLVGWLHLRQNAPVPVEGETLRSHGTPWLERRDASPDHRDSRNDRSRWKHVARAPFYDWPLVSITRRAIRAWVATLPGSPQTVRHCLNLLRRCLADAVEDELLERNPAADVAGPPRTLREKQQWTYLLPAEQEALTGSAAIPEHDRLIMSIALATGLRQGEQWCLELSDVHVDDAEPSVWVRWGGPNEAPKNGKERRVPLTGIALDAMNRWLELLPSYAKTNPLGLAFPTARGKRRRMKKPLRDWLKYLAIAKLNEPATRHDRKGVRWHDIRHSCATSLVNGWWGRRWTLQEACELLGHSSVQTTERYAHLAPSSLAQAAAETRGASPKQPAAAVAEPSQDRPTPEPVAIENSLEKAARHSGFEPLAFGSGGRELSGDIILGIAASGRSWDAVKEARDRYLKAIASRNRFAHRYGVELAELVTDVLAAVELTSVEWRQARVKVAQATSARTYNLTRPVIDRMLGAFMAKSTMSVAPHLAERIREIRHALSLTQEQLSELMGVHRVDVVRLENGQNKATSHAMRTALSRGFGLSLADLERFLHGEIDVKAALRLRAKGPRSTRRAHHRRTGTDG